MRNENERARHQNRKISEITIHPFYTGGPDPNKSFSDVLNYNFALLHMEEDFCFNNHISHVCLPDLPNIKTGRPSNWIVFILNLNSGHLLDSMNAKLFKSIL